MTSDFRVGVGVQNDPKKWTLYGKNRRTWWVGGSKIIKNQRTSFMDVPLGKWLPYSSYKLQFYKKLGMGNLGKSGRVFSGKFFRALHSDFGWKLIVSTNSNKSVIVKIQSWRLKSYQVKKLWTYLVITRLLLTRYAFECRNFLHRLKSSTVLFIRFNSIYFGSVFFFKWL